MPIALVSFSIWYYLLQAWAVVKNFIRAPEKIEEFFYKLATAKGKKSEELVDKIGALNVHFGHIAGYISQSLDAEVPIDKTIDEVSSKELSLVEKNVGILKALVAAAPLLGLLGTVFGMIETFGVISLKSANVSELMASGISKALITTQCGLVVALPGLFGVAFLNRMLRRARVRFSVLETHVHIGLRGEGK
jgi:biopolymer transport protein ExbB